MLSDFVSSHYLGFFNLKFCHCEIFQILDNIDGTREKNECYIRLILTWQHVLLQTQQWKHRNSVRNMFQVNNKDTLNVLNANFKQISYIVLVFPLYT